MLRIHNHLTFFMQLSVSIDYFVTWFRNVKRSFKFVKNNKRMQEHLKQNPFNLVCAAN